MNYEDALQEMHLAANLAGSQPVHGEVPKLRYDFAAGIPEENLLPLDRWPRLLGEYDVVFVLNCLNCWSRDVGKELIAMVLGMGKPLVVSIPKILYPTDPVNSLWSWSDFTEFEIVHDVSTWHWLVYRLGC